MPGPRRRSSSHHLGIAPDEAHLFQRLANRILYADPSLRPLPEVLRRAGGGPSALWPYGISGDVPIVLVGIDEPEDQEIVRQLLRAHEYWRLKRLAVDLVMVNEQAASYAQELQGALETLVRTSQSTVGQVGHAPHGGVFILLGERLSPADRLLLQTAARAVLLSRRGTLAEQVARADRAEAAAGGPVRAASHGATPPRRCRRRGRTSSSSTASEASRPAAGSTSRSWARDSGRRRRG